MGPVQRVACLKGDNPSPTHRPEFLSQFSRGMVIFRKIKIPGESNSAQTAAEIQGASFLKKISNPRMRLIEGTEDAFRFPFKVDPPDVFHVQNGEQRSMGVPQGEPGALLEPVSHVFGHVEHDGNGPQRPVFKAHGFQNAVVVLSIYISSQRRECAVQQQFEVA